MSDEMQGILNYINVQIKTFEMIEGVVKSDFNAGVISGLQLARTWIDLTCKKGVACDTTVAGKENQ